MAQDKIRVLIVDDINETRENIKRMLQFDSSIEVIGSARSGREAIEMTQKDPPDVVLMDINMPDMDGITATENIRRKFPFVHVVILSVQNDPSYMRRAMLAGARDFLSKPPMIDELSSAIRRAGSVAHEERKKSTGSMMAAIPGVNVISGLQQAARMPTGSIIVAYGPKGGVGRTTIATNLAIALQTPETKIALIDASLQFGDIAVFLNEQGKNTIIDLTSRVDELDPDIINEVMVVHAATGVHLLAAPPRPELAERVSGEQFTKLVKYLQQIYTYIVIDTGAYLNDAVLAALDMANIIVLITTQEIPSIKSCNLFLSLADMMKIQRASILFTMNRFDKRIAISPDKVGESLRQEIVATIPFDDRLVTTSVNRGIPFMLDNKTHIVSKAIISLADMIKERIEKSYAPLEQNTPAGKR